MTRFGFLVVAASLAMGCATAKLTIHRPLQSPVESVSLSIHPASPDQMTAEDSSRLKSTLVSVLVDAGVPVTSREAGKASVDGAIQQFDPGNRALRYFVGFGAGTGRFSAEWVVNDSSGTELGACRVDGSIGMGAFGGSYDDVLEMSGERLAEFLLKTD